MTEMPTEANFEAVILTGQMFANVQGILGEVYGQTSKQLDEAIQYDLWITQHGLLHCRQDSLLELLMGDMPQQVAAGLQQVQGGDSPAGDHQLHILVYEARLQQYTLTH